MALPEITQPVLAWMLHSDPETGSFKIWEITVVSGPTIRHPNRQVYRILPEKRLVWSYRNKEDREIKSTRPQPQYYSLSAAQIAFTPEELKQKFEEGQQHFVRYKQGDVTRTIDNIKFAEREIAALRSELKYSKESEEEMQQINFADTGL